MVLLCLGNHRLWLCTDLDDARQVNGVADDFALENGVDTIEHGARVNDEIIRLFKERNAAVVTTLSPVIPYAMFDPSVFAFPEAARHAGRTVLEGNIECARECLKNGIPVGLGNDVGVDFVTHYDFWRELVYFKKYCGVSSAFASLTITEDNDSYKLIPIKNDSFEPNYINKVPTIIPKVEKNYTNNNTTVNTTIDDDIGDINYTYNSLNETFEEYEDW